MSFRAITLLFLTVNSHALITAQSPITAFTSSYVQATNNVLPYNATPAPNSGSFASCASAVFNYSFGNTTSNALKLSAIVTNGKNYFAVPNKAIIRLRRVNNANVSGQRSIIFLESTTAPVANCPSTRRFNFKSVYQDQMEIFLNNTIINQGTDNIFTNASNSDGNNNNIERVDVIFPAGVSSFSVTDAGFVLIDRGNNNGHDRFRITPVLSVDGLGNPSSFGRVVTCNPGNGTNNGSWGHPTLANGNVNLSVYVSRKEQSELFLRASASINQQLGGVFFSLADLGVASNQKIYGYSLIGPDGLANPTSAQLLNISDAAVYPPNTTEAIGGGLDLIAVNALFSTGEVILAGLKTQLYAQRQNEKIIVDWSVDGLESPTHVELQRSQDGSHFTGIYSGVHDSASAGSRYTDHVAAGIGYYYRLKIAGSEGVAYYSKMFHVKPAGESGIIIYPSLLQAGGKVNVRGLNEKRFRIMIFSMDGRKIFSNSFINNGESTFNIPPTGFTKGLYFITFTSEAGMLLYSSKVRIG